MRGLRQKRAHVVPPDPAIQRIANRLAPRLRRAFLRAVDGYRGAIPEDILADALRASAVTPALLTRLELIAPLLEQAAKINTTVFTTAGKQAAVYLNQHFGLSMAFGEANPRAIEAAAQLGARLVTQVGDETKETIRELVSRGLVEGRAPDAVARQIREVIGLTTRQADAVQAYRDALLQQGRALGDVDRLTQRYGEKLLNYRSKMIARHETLTASNRGQQELWLQAREQGELDAEAKRVWSTAGDERTCDLCEPMDGELAELDGPWETDEGPVMTPQDIHVQCRCGEGLEWP